jgi:pyridoxamine 5'-phosphate oxidase
MNKESNHLRKEYSKFELDESHIVKDPILQFKSWYNDALKSGNPYCNAMALSTADKNGRPSSRYVLLKEITENGFVFYTNYQSRKANDIEQNPYVALTFFWPELERQVRIEGIVEKLDAKESDTYFQSRPIGSKIAAWASPQSIVIENRNLLQSSADEISIKYKNKHLPRPDFWGGYIVIPDMVEFWQGRPDRLNDRIRYMKQDELWKIERLAP